MTDQTAELRLAVPSDGDLHEPAVEFLRSCGLGISRPNPRRYTAEIPTLPGITVWFQRNADITHRVSDSSADLGIVGRDRHRETRRGGGTTNVVIEDLQFGHSELVIGVPDFWLDVTSLADLAAVALDFRREGRDLRIATKYPRLVEPMLSSNGIKHFSFVPASGTLEAAPKMGYADIIADISSSGNTMRVNGLKPIEGGYIPTSEACLISNGTTLGADDRKRRLAEALVERIEAHLRSRTFYSVTANIRMVDKSADDVARKILQYADISGLRGPTISKVYTGDDHDWYAVTVVVEKESLLSAVEQLRGIGDGKGSVTVSQPSYVFDSECNAQTRLV